MKVRIGYFRKSWNLAFVKGGMDAVFADRPLEVEVVTNPYKDRWFADPFILDVAENKIFLLAEEFRYAHPIGRIAKLTIDKRSMKIEKMDILSDCPTHMSFPNILRREGKIFVYPENCRSGRLDMYEYDSEQEKLINAKTICKEGLWDTSMTNLLGQWQLYGGFRDDYNLDICNWNEDRKLFVYSHSLVSTEKNNRLAGQLFEYKGNIYIPTQNCSHTYGDSVYLKRVEGQGKDMRLVIEKELLPPSNVHAEGLHTLNEYKGLVVIDLKVWLYPIVGKMYHLYKKLVGKKKKLNQKLR